MRKLNSLRWVTAQVDALPVVVTSMQELLRVMPALLLSVLLGLSLVLQNQLSVISICFLFFVFFFLPHLPAAILLSRTVAGCHVQP